MSIAIVTDSTADMPGELAQANGLTVVPLNVSLEGKQYKDGVDLDREHFFEMMSASSELPKTSQPSPGDFEKVYRELAKDYEAIVSVHISSKVSGTCQSAIQGKEALSDESVHIEVVDTLQASMALGLTALGTAEAVKGGASFEEAVRKARSLAAKARFLGMVETLEYLYKGGRIGRANLMLGSFLKIKPLLQFTDGEARPLDRPRTRAKAIESLIKIAGRNVPFKSAWVLHANCLDDAQMISSRITELASDDKANVTIIGPTIGTYLGPGAIGLAFMTE